MSQQEKEMRDGVGEPPGETGSPYLPPMTQEHLAAIRSSKKAQLGIEAKKPRELDTTDSVVTFLDKALFLSRQNDRMTDMAKPLSAADSPSVCDYEGQIPEQPPVELPWLKPLRQQTPGRLQKSERNMDRHLRNATGNGENKGRFRTVKKEPFKSNSTRSQSIVIVRFERTNKKWQPPFPL